MLLCHHQFLVRSGAIRGVRTSVFHHRPRDGKVPKVELQGLGGQFESMLLRSRRGRGPPTVRESIARGARPDTACSATVCGDEVEIIAAQYDVPRSISPILATRGLE